jgi:hypothetical protein
LPRGADGVILGFVPIPLPDAFLEALRDSTAALAAAFIIASWHPEVFEWAVKVMRPEVGEPEPVRVRSVPKSPRRLKSNGVRKSHNDGSRLAKRDSDDLALLAALRANPEGSIGDWATAVGKSRTSIVSALHRLRDAGLAQSVEGKWKLTEAPAPREPPVRWVKPPSAVREHATA